VSRNLSQPLINNKGVLANSLPQSVSPPYKQQTCDVVVTTQFFSPDPSKRCHLTRWANIRLSRSYHRVCDIIVLRRAQAPCLRRSQPYSMRPECTEIVATASICSSVSYNVFIVCKIVQMKISFEAHEFKATIETGWIPIQRPILSQLSQRR